MQESSSESEPKLAIEGLSRKHDRPSFYCGEETLDTFLRAHAVQAQEKDLSRTYVLVEPGKPEVLGYYTLCIGQVEFEALPIEHVKRLPRHPVPVVRLARLAVDHHYQRRGFGELLVIDAMYRAVNVANTIGVRAVEVDALTKDVVQWYRTKFKFIALEDSDRHLFLSIREIRNWLAAGES